MSADVRLDKIEALSAGPGKKSGREESLFSSLPARRTPMLAVAGSQQCLQSHLYKCLEVIASLPSALLRGDETQTDTFTGNTQQTPTSSANI